MSNPDKAQEIADNNRINDKTAMESVDLIASGYEWICPRCNELNREIETLEVVTCRNCQNGSFTVGTVNHATG